MDDFEDEPTATTTLKLTVKWHGDYYDSDSERADTLTYWIMSALDDRDDCPTVTFEEIN